MAAEDGWIGEQGLLLFCCTMLFARKTEASVFHDVRVYFTLFSLCEEENATLKATKIEK